MTNFQSISSSRKRFITPESAVFVLPILGGVFLSLLLASFALSPLVMQLNERRTRVAQMERKRDELPLKRNQLELLLQRRNKLLFQQNGLLDLLAGSQGLKTWLAKLNRTAFELKVDIVDIVPQRIERYVLPPQVEDSKKSKKSKKSKSKSSVRRRLSKPGDKLLVPGIEKHSAVVIFQAPFNELLELLRQTELYEVMVIASDLELELTSQASTGKPSETRLKLKFTTYGRSNQGLPSKGKD